MDDFYAARGRTFPPLPWPNFAPPLSWVPWEIGVATEKDYPIATYAGDKTSLPEYLKKWPYLQSEQELDVYAKVSKQAHETYVNNKRHLNEEVSRKSGRRLFYRQLREKLGQS